MGNCKKTSRRHLGFGLNLIFLLAAQLAPAQPIHIPIPRSNNNFQGNAQEVSFSYTGNGPTLSLSTVDGKLSSFTLPKVSQRARFILRGADRQGFSQLIAPTYLEKLMGGNYWSQPKNIEKEALTIISDGLNTEISLNGELSVKTIRLTVVTQKGQSPVPGRVQGNRSADFTYTPSTKNTEQREEVLFFYPELFGGKINLLRLDHWITAVAFEESPSEGLVPKADLGTLFAFAREVKDLGSFGVIAWAGRPEIKIFIFKDYESQSAHFRRLAFYVEKRGFRGRLLSNQQLSRLHGWNAHNYRAQDLAAFFQQAADEKFTLNTEELDLRQKLLDWGIIKRVSGGFQPGEGAILSIAQVTSSLTMERFLKHEFVHGLYFVDFDFEKKVAAIWEKTPDSFKVLWSSFLAWASYDESWDYLVINELAGYLLSYEDQRALEEYLQVLLARALRRYPEMDNSSNRDIWWDTLDWVVPALREAFREECGLNAQKMFTLDWY
jgi:hypothetical protein